MCERAINSAVAIFPTIVAANQPAPRPFDISKYLPLWGEGTLDNGIGCEALYIAEREMFAVIVTIITRKIENYCCELWSRRMCLLRTIKKKTIRYRMRY